MKKLMIAAAIVCAAVTVNAATVGWTNAGMNSYVGDKYSIFVIGQKGVTSIATITALLDAGNDISGYQFGGGTVAANGAANVQASASGLSLGVGTYTSFIVLFDGSDPSSGNNKYALFSGASGQQKEVSATTSSITFTTGNQATFWNNTANWKSFGPTETPEPTSAMLMLLGVAGLALRRKQK